MTEHDKETKRIHRQTDEKAWAIQNDIEGEDRDVKGLHMDAYNIHQLYKKHQRARADILQLTYVTKDERLMKKVAWAVARAVWEGAD